MRLLFRMVFLNLVCLGASEWRNEEQFVEGDFPYYPYDGRTYSSPSDVASLTEEKGFSQENGGKFIISSNFGFNQRKRGGDILKTKRNDMATSSFYQSLNPPVPNSVHFPSRGSTGRNMAEKKVMLKNIKKKKAGDVTEKIVNSNNSRREGYIGGKNKLSDTPVRLYPRCSDQAHMNSNFSSRLKKMHEIFSGRAKYDDSLSKSRIVSKPVQMRLKSQEGKFNSGEGRFANPNTILAKGIADFIKRKDYRWLDFMKNTGLDLKGNFESESEEEGLRLPANDKDSTLTFSPLGQGDDESRVRLERSNAKLRKHNYRRNIDQLTKENIEAIPPQAKENSGVKDLKLHIKVYVEDGGNT